MAPPIRAPEAHIPGQLVAIAVFDDRIEVRSVGGLPRGITAEALQGSHRSVLRNPLIAEAFHRTGAAERAGAAYVTFRAKIGPTATEAARVGTKSAPNPNT